MRELNVAVIEVGSKGLKVGFRNNYFAAADALIDWVGQNSERISITPQQNLLIHEPMSKSSQRLKRAEQLLHRLRQLLETS